MRRSFSSAFKITITSILTTVLLFIATGCQAALSENTIKSAFNQYAFPIGESVEIKNVEVLRRSTEDKEDISLCQVDTVGKTASYTSYFSVIYKYYDKGGWILENIDPTDIDKWTATYNETGIKTIEDASEDVNSLCGGLPVEREYLTLTWEENSSPKTVNTDSDGQKLAQVFNGTATYTDDFCKIDVPLQLIYFFETSWHDNQFTAHWEYAYSYSKLLEDVNDCVHIDLSGTWVGDSPYGAPLVLTLDMDDKGYPYGKLECEVPADNYSHYPDGVEPGGVIDFGCSDMSYVPNIDLSYKDYWASRAFEFRGKGNKNYIGWVDDWVYLQDLILDMGNRTLTGRYWRSYGTTFDVVLTWQGR